MTESVTKLKVMTWNIYQGANLIPLFTSTPEQIPQGVTEVFRQFLATNFPERAKAIANQIILKEPDIIGLQEAEIWELIPPNAETVTYDFVEILLNELRSCGLDYSIAAQNFNTESLLPSSTGNVIGLKDRDVILVREASKVKVIQKFEANFNASLKIVVAGQPITILRGWSAIDACIEGHKFRFVNTHLEPLSPTVQVAQAEELLEGPAKTKLPLIFAGDFNSFANGTGTPTYQILIAAGFADTWNIAGTGNGFTCCQDADVINAVSYLNYRIDLILIKELEQWDVIKVDVVGEAQSDRTNTRLWPSDHAGVVAKLNIKC
ncbi:MAG: endonuclease [Clostridiales bacterium GWB2_37_7]|nr:MAG: endonuclease [Clostridiales bacterium GWB2_37_7]